MIITAPPKIETKLAMKLKSSYHSLTENAFSPPRFSFTICPKQRCFFYYHLFAFGYIPNKNVLFFFNFLISTIDSSIFAINSCVFYLLLQLLSKFDLCIFLSFFPQRDKNKQHTVYTIISTVTDNWLDGICGIVLVYTRDGT